jgi:hypothetical protein
MSARFYERKLPVMDEDHIFEDCSFFYDDGTEINPDLVPTPPLCVTCKRNDLQGEEYILCTLTRADQADEDDFECEDYQSLG